MAFITTYSSLKDSLILYVNRKDPSLLECIPISIMMAQQRINVDAKFLYSELYLDGTLTAGNPTLIKPGLWSSTLNFSIGTGTGFLKRKPLFERSYEFIEIAWPLSSETSEPVHYANFQANAWMIAPTPDQSYPYSICCQLMSFPLSEESQSNWITVYCPELIQFAARAEVERFLHNYEEATYNDTKYQEALKARILENAQKKTDRFTDLSKD